MITTWDNYFLFSVWNTRWNIGNPVEKVGLKQHPFAAHRAVFKGFKLQVFNKNYMLFIGFKIDFRQFEKLKIVPVSLIILLIIMTGNGIDSFLY